MFVGKESSEHSDTELIGLFKLKSDPSALADLFVRYSALVYGVCLKYLKDRDDAKDAVMQIFEKLSQSLKDHEIEYFKSWLYSTTRNHCLMQLRARKKVLGEEIDENVMETSFVLHHEDDISNELEITKLEKCIEQLRNGQKDCIRLFYLKEMCYKEIVDQTGIELKKVKSHIQNGKRNLKICMEQSG
ncbi:MAG TPA: sigma-70 family RNA polymerase sigma factor [Cyclobacteriaceae bacterium]|nr:sigma-70 family RNA polymerase sigma factor [Cyclobacteriaceae bacterium]